MASILPAVAALPAGQEGGLVRGSVHAKVLRDRLIQENLEQTSVRLVFLADFPVKLVDDAGVTVANGRTDVFGRYALRAPNNGNYFLCWDGPGWIAECAPGKIAIRNNIVYPKSATARPDIGKGAVWGEVRDAGGTAPYFAEEFFDIHANARISATDLAGRTLGAAKPNVSGEYVLVALGATTIRATATLEGARQSRLISATEVQGNQVDFRLPNSRIQLGAMVARDAAGQGVREAATGADVGVSVEASDADADALTFEWRASPNGGKVTPLGGGRAEWTLGSSPGQQSLYVIASDGKGGYATKSVSLSVGGTKAVFSGMVTDAGGKPIAGAKVKANATVGKTDARGGFTVSVNRAGRYLVSVSAPGYLTATKVYDRSLASQTYRLTKASVHTVDPTADIVLRDTRRELEAMQMRGASVVIPAGALVGPDGSRATTPLTAQITTINVANGEMPGDFGARDRTGRETNLISFGAVDIEIRDGAGKVYNLGPGQTAQVEIPVPANMPSPPSRIALWTFNPKTGFWDQEIGTATLKGGFYSGTVTHFSTFNADLAKSDAACVRVLLDNINRNQLRAKVVWDSGGTSFVQQPEFLLGDALNAMYRLPPNTNVRVRIFDAGTNTEVTSAQLLDASQAVLTNNVVNTGAASLPLFPSAPYDNCVSTSVRLPIPVGSISRIPFLSFTLTGSLDQAVGYYRGLNAGLTFTPNAADPNGGTYSGGTVSTLGAWWAQAGFDASGGGGTRAAYLNHGDLGFGRDMHMRKTGSGNVFAYVTNYGGANQNGVNADLANTANTATALATVAMQYTSIPGIPGRTVQFYVYAGGQASGRLLNSADLDGFGQKFVPNLCQNCHGGAVYAPVAPAAPSNVDLSLRASLSATVGASFREFDLGGLRFPPGGATTPDPATLPRYRALNDMVVATNPQVGITELINGWYASAASPSSPPDLTFTPAAWKSSAEPQRETLYRQVVAHVCRTCHIAFDQNSPTSGITWTTYDQFKNSALIIQPYVCGNNKLMPHTLMAYRNFWLSTGPHMPSVLGSFSAAGWTSFGGCQ